MRAEADTPDRKGATVQWRYVVSKRFVTPSGGALRRRNGKGTLRYCTNLRVKLRQVTSVSATTVAVRSPDSINATSPVWFACAVLNDFAAGVRIWMHQSFENNVLCVGAMEEAEVGIRRSPPAVRAIPIPTPTLAQYHLLPLTLTPSSPKKSS